MAVRKRAPRRTPPKRRETPPADTAVPDEEYRLGDGIEIVRTTDGIALVNARVSGVREFPYEVVSLLAKLLDWTTLGDLVRSVATGDATAAEDRADRSAGPVELETALDFLDGLVELDALASRNDDLSGRRLQSPGPGWAFAQAFLRSTRTTRATQFIDSFAIADDLAAKAAVYRQPSAFYERVDAPFTPLPAPDDRRRPSPSFDDVLLQRRTSRRFSTEPLSLDDFAMVLHRTWGATALVENQLGDYFLRKTSPSGGALHTIEVYPIVLNVEGIDPGAYHYSVRRHGLERLSDAHPGEWIAAACGDQEWIAETGVVFACTSFLPRMAWKYDFSRAFRAIMAESGFTSQTAFLVAASLNLGCCTTLALRDEMFEDVLGLDPTREPVLLVTGVGTLEADIDDHSRPRAESAATTM